MKSPALNLDSFSYKYDPDSWGHFEILWSWGMVCGGFVYFVWGYFFSLLVLSPYRLQAWKTGGKT